MSNFKVQGNASGAGTFTLQSPNIAGNLSLTMPAADGTNGQFLQTNGSGVLSFASVTPAGVVQVKSTAKTDVFSTSSGTMVDVTGLSVSITPTSASNKILVLVNLVVAGATATDECRFQLVRNSTDIAKGTGGTPAYTSYMTNYNLSNTPTGVTEWPAALNFLDSPASTSALTYKIQMSTSNSSTWYLNRRGDSATAFVISNITVMEVTP